MTKGRTLRFGIESKGRYLTRRIFQKGLASVRIVTSAENAGGAQIDPVAVVARMQEYNNRIEGKPRTRDSNLVLLSQPTPFPPPLLAPQLRPSVTNTPTKNLQPMTIEPLIHWSFHNHIVLLRIGPPRDPKPDCIFACVLSTRDALRWAIARRRKVTGFNDHQPCFLFLSELASPSLSWSLSAFAGDGGCSVFGLLGLE